MKIGLITYHAACNYGANLQALSNLKYWQNNGYEPIFINWMTEKLENGYRRITPQDQFEEHRLFREKYFSMTRRCYTDEDIVAVIKEEGIEAIIIGSDAVMQTRPQRTRFVFPSRKIFTIVKPGTDVNPPNPFWGSFYSLLERKIPIIYMSASSQNSSYKKSSIKEKQLQQKLLLQYDYISTRDDWTSKMVSWITDGKINPEVTPDPVFAFNYNVINQPSKEEILRKFNLNDKYCLFCFHSNKAVSKKWLIKMQKLMNKKDIQCVAFPFPSGIKFDNPFDKRIDIPLSPIDWYALIKYATYYIGDNMHPIVISLHNAVPCFSFDHYGVQKFFRLFVDKKSSKIYHILNKFRCINNIVNINGIYREPTVEYVMESLERFDKEYVRKCADTTLLEYLKMMTDIKTIIDNSVSK